MSKLLNTWPKKLLLVLCCLHLIVNWFWLSQNQAPLPWDQAGHTRLATEFAHYWQGTYAKPYTLTQISPYYPPLTHLVASFAIALFGNPIFTSSLIVSGYFLALLIGIFFTAGELSKNEWIGFLTALFFSLYPPVYENSRWFLLELPLLTWLVWSFYWLKKSDAFTHWQPSFFFALSVATLLLTKWTGIIFLTIPVMFSLASRIKKGLHTTHLTQFVLLASVISLLTIPWYLTNFEFLRTMSYLALQGEITDPQSFLSSDNLLFYFKHILNFQLTIWPAIVALSCWIWLTIFHRKNQAHLVNSYLLFGYFIFTFIGNKDIRYTLPLLLGLAFSTAVTLIHFWQRKNIIISSLIGSSLLVLFCYFGVLSFHLLPTYQKAIPLGVLGWIDYVNTGDIVVHAPQSDMYPNQAIMQFLLQKHRHVPASVMVGIDQPYLNPANLYLASVIAKSNTLSFEAPAFQVEFESEAAISEYLHRFTYILIPSGSVGPDAVRHKKALEQAQQYLFSHPEQFTLVKTYPLLSTQPNGDKVYLYNPK